MEKLIGQINPSAGSHRRFYPARKAFGIWLAAVLPFFLLITLVVPDFARATGVSAVFLFWILLPFNAAWLFSLALWIIRREEGDLRRETLRRRIRMAFPDPNGKRTARAGFWILLGIFLALNALFMGVAVPSAGSAMLYFVPFPFFTNLEEAGSPEFAGQWGWVLLVTVTWLLNMLAAEELVFRGLLLPKMKSAFWNGVLYGLFYLASPLLIPFRLLTGWVAAGLAGRFGSLRPALAVRGVEGIVILSFALAGVTAPRFPPLGTAVSFPHLLSNGSDADVRPVATLTALRAYVPNPGDAFQVDLRSADLSALDLRNAGRTLDYACFDDHTVWPVASRLPAGFDPQALMEWGKNPGLGLADLHARGITGKGIGIAIIDQGLLIGHQEFTDRLIEYEEITHNGINNIASFHATSVASIAAGKTTGVAPEARLYFIASNDILFRDFFWKMHNYAEAIRRIVQLNAFLPSAGRIRVISISLGANPLGMTGSADFSQAVREAEAAGISTIYTPGTSAGYVGLAGATPLADADDPNSYDQSVLAQIQYKDRPDILLIPADSRTLADSSGNGDYWYCRTGGLSWMMPYAAGVFTLAAQVDPWITLDEFWQLAFQTGDPLTIVHDGVPYQIGKLIDPSALIAALRD